MKKRYLKPGDKRGKLTVVERSGIDRWGARLWVCLCECGNTKEMLASHINHKKMPSCGCYSNKAKGDHSRTHGLTKTREFNSWKGMKSRCYNPKNKHYKDYGGRGISVCERWLLSFESFYSDMGAKPDKSLSIERLDVNGDYTPENCIWADSKQQAKTRRTTLLVPWKGGFSTFREIGDELGISNGAAYRRHERGTLNADT